MKKLFSIFILLNLSLFCSAQIQDTVYKEVDKVVDFEEGMASLFKYIMTNFHYPQEDKSYPTRVVLRFIVQRNNEVKDIKVLRTSGSTLFDDEAIRVIKSVKGWKAAYKDGQKVNSYFTLPLLVCLRE